jgi:hypothetical protein
MIALLYRKGAGWNLMLAMSDVRGLFASERSARNYARMHGFRIKRAAKLDTILPAVG